MPKKAKDELCICEICQEEVRRDKSWQYGNGRACKKHPEAQEVHNTPQPVAPPMHTPVATLQRPKTRVDETYIIEALKGKPKGTKVRITFKPNAFSEVAYLVMMKDKIITMDDPTFTGLYAVGISGQWDRISRTCEVTINFNRGSLEEWFAPRLGRGVEKLEVV